MSLRDHLVEMRKRLLRIAVGLLIGAVGGWFLADPVMELLFSPLHDLAAKTGQDMAPNFSDVGGPIDMKLRVAVFLGAVVSSPWWIYQLWAFVTPGLTTKERRRTIGLVVLAVPMFLSGVFFAWWAVPTIVSLFTSVTPDGALNLIDAQGYLAFVLQMMLTFGITFMLPLFMVGLTLAQLVRGRTWMKGWRWAVILISVIAAIVTPTPDLLSMFMVAGPLLALYFMAVGICTLIDRRNDRKLAAEGLLVDPVEPEAV
ncbi:MAG: twin-arginine translocase subunit TatC [Micrococcales bacterium]|nr:twin-arginine translocase subunit TatC [Micrococcales bacterium]